MHGGHGGGAGGGITGAPAPSSVTVDLVDITDSGHTRGTHVNTCETLYTVNNFQWNRRCQNIFLISKYL